MTLPIVIVCTLAAMAMAVLGLAYVRDNNGPMALVCLGIFLVNFGFALHFGYKLGAGS